MQEYNNCDLVYSLNPQDQSAGNLWLGDYTSARNRKLHRSLAISTVVTAGLGMQLALSHPLSHKVYGLYDHPSENIQRHAYEYIEQALQKGNVLVHCYAGVSRSSTIVISFLMKKMQWPMKEALQHVRSKRWVVRPNPGFMQQLKAYEKQLAQLSQQLKEKRQILNMKKIGLVSMQKTDTVKMEKIEVKQLLTNKKVLSNSISKTNKETLVNSKKSSKNQFKSNSSDTHIS